MLHTLFSYNPSEERYLEKKRKRISRRKEKRNKEKKRKGKMTE